MEKEKIFLIGATGNVGRAIIKHLDVNKFSVTVGVRDVEKSKILFKRKLMKHVHFDLEKQKGFEQIKNHSIVFLLRPPQIGDVKKYFEPLISTISQFDIKLLVFLSVQGADQKSFIPHSRIEKLIMANNLPYVFIRPSYFMDNLITTLYSEIKRNRRIFLPSGKLQLNWIDVNDIGELIAKSVFNNVEDFKNTVINATNSKNQDFFEIVNAINQICNTNIKYDSTNIMYYIIYMLKTKHSISYIAVMLLLHFIPRFEQEPLIFPDLQNLLDREPTQISEFVRKNKPLFLN